MTWPVIKAHLDKRLDQVRTALESATPEQVGILQGEAKALRGLLNLPQSLTADPDLRLEPEKAHY